MTENEGLAWIAKLFEVTPRQLSPDTSRDDIEAWDSLGLLTLMSSLDSDFGVTLTDEELQEIWKVDDILQILRRNGIVK